MKIVSWNVNSIKARLEHVKRFLSETAPDVLMVQELKGLDFPADEFKALGYDTAAVPQKAYNGVAVFSKTPITVLHEKLPGDETDEQARYIEFEISPPLTSPQAGGEAKPGGSLRLINIYLPNGNPIGTEKFDYKLKWLGRLFKHLQTLRAENIPFAIGGDFNVIPEDKDCYDPKAWAGDALFRPESKAALRALENLGLYDAFRIINSAGGHYTFWDYQAGAWQKDHGIRIDHFMLSPELTDRLINCTIDRNPRGWDTPSDHTPIMIEIAA